MILAEWAKYLPKFRKIMPVEYAKALEEIARQQQADTTGLDELEIGMPLKGKKREEARSGEFVWPRRVLEGACSRHSGSRTCLVELPEMLNGMDCGS